MLLLQNIGWLIRDDERATFSLENSSFNLAFYRKEYKDRLYTTTLCRVAIEINGYSFMINVTPCNTYIELCP